MPRRSKKEESPVAIFFIIIIGVALAAFNIAVFLYPVVISLAIILGRIASDHPEVPDPSDFDDALDGMAVAVQLIERDQGLSEKERLIAVAEQEGLRPTKGSGYSRYDSRRGIASEINARLDIADDRIQACERKIYRIRSERYGILPNWKAIVVKWVTWRSIGSAGLLSVKMAGLTALALLLLSMSAPSSYSRLIDASAILAGYLAFQPVNLETMAALLIVVIVGYAAFAVGYWTSKKKIFATVDLRILHGWRTMDEKWNPSSGYADFQIYRNLIADDPINTEAPVVTPDDDHWSNILGVSVDATAEEIKIAYRRMMKSYHSDRVADLGPKLQALAEEESKRINLAYEQAKAAMGN